MVKIYCIEDCDGLKYVGSTIQKLNKRLYHHRCHNECTSRELNLYDCKIYLLEECDDNFRKDREQYWIDNTECVNKMNTIFDRKQNRKQYYQQNKDKLREHHKQYRQENRDKLREHNKQYRQKNRDKLREYDLKCYHFKNSWGGDPRNNNNLLKIDINIFL